MKRFIFSELGMSLKGTKGSIPETVLAGKTEDVNFAAKEELSSLMVTWERWWFFPIVCEESCGMEKEELGWQDELTQVDSSKSGLLLRGSLLRNCLSMVHTQLMNQVNLKTL